MKLLLLSSDEGMMRCDVLRVIYPSSLEWCQQAEPLFVHGDRIEWLYDPLHLNAPTVTSQTCPAGDVILGDG